MLLAMRWPCALANCTYPEKKQTSCIFVTGGSFATWRQALIQVRFLPSQKLGGGGAISPDFLRKTFLAHKADKRPRFSKEFICISKNEESTCNFKFVEVNAIRKWKGRKSLLFSIERIIPLNLKLLFVLTLYQKLFIHWLLRTFG